MKLHSVKFKISILYTVILGAILVIYSAILYLNLSYVIYHETDRDLRKKAVEIEEIIRNYSEKFEADKENTPVSLKRAVRLDEYEQDELFQWPSIKKLDQSWKYKAQALGIKLDYIVIYHPSGEIAEKSNNVEDPILKILEASFKAVPKNKAIIKNYLSRDVHLRIITLPFHRWDRIRYIIQLATPLEPQLFILKSKLKLIVISVPIFMFLASFIGRFLVIKIFEPINDITETARNISYKDMSKRVELAHADEELQSLVDGFNDMISRLERSFKYIEEFSSNAAHELKTPLAIIRGELEVALRKNRSAEDYRKAIDIALDETQKMLHTVNDLLLLSKLDYQTEVFKFESLDLSEFLAEIYEQTKTLASERDILVSYDPPPQPLTINADRLHLRRLFLNLIDNSIKFTAKGGKINIKVQRSGDYAHIAISDTGVGIAEEDLPKIFERFFHVDRTKEAPSVTGLGLSLVQSIAKIHSGAIDVTSQLGIGSTFTVKLPIIKKI